MKNKFSKIEEALEQVQATPQDIPETEEALEELKKKVVNLEERLTYFFSKRSKH